MHTRHKLLLVIDAGINLLLGGLLLLFPLGIAARLGLPPADSAFYPVILGGVLFGIGLALLLEAFGEGRGLHGLGMAGAIAINFCGAGVLAVWLVAVPSTLPLRGQLLLWTIAVGVLAIGLIEWLVGAGRP
jgi:hypothetical protein